jgi:hypothetical protein
LLKIPFGKSLAIASFTGMQQPSRRFSDHVSAVIGRIVGGVVTVVMSPLRNGYHQTPVGISDNLHVVTPLGHHFVPVIPNLKGASRTTIVTDIYYRLSVNSLKGSGFVDVGGPTSIISDWRLAAWRAHGQPD